MMCHLLAISFFNLRNSGLVSLVRGQNPTCNYLQVGFGFYRTSINL